MKVRMGLFAGLAAVILASPARSDDAPALPGLPFAGDRYANLWKQSPFAIATPDAPAASEDYELVGAAQFDGVSYVSLIDKQDQYHFVLASDHPYQDPKQKLDLKLVSITQGHDGSSAVILRNGEPLTLHQNQGVAGQAPPGGAPGSPAAIVTPNSRPDLMPSPNPSVGGFVPVNSVPPSVRFHRRLIHIPPPPN